MNLNFLKKIFGKKELIDNFSVKIINKQDLYSYKAKTPKDYRELLGFWVDEMSSGGLNIKVLKDYSEKNGVILLVL